MLYTLRFFSSKCSLFHNANSFGSCIIHILYTECAKIKKKIIPAPKGLATEKPLLMKGSACLSVWWVLRPMVTHSSGRDPYACRIGRWRRIGLTTPESPVSRSLASSVSPHCLWRPFLLQQQRQECNNRNIKICGLTQLCCKKYN